LPALESAAERGWLRTSKLARSRFLLITRPPQNQGFEFASKSRK
jgi:hypothetical protein